MNDAYLQVNTKDNKQRTVALRDPGSDKIVALAFEDNVDDRFNDATFYLDIDEDAAIDVVTPELPNVGTPPSDIENYSIKTGTLAFEDLWPNMGDFDLNDVIVE